MALMILTKMMMMMMILLQLRLGSSADTPEIGELVLSTLCPAVYKVVSDGLKTYLAGVQVFGRVQVTIWKLTEASAEQGTFHIWWLLGRNENLIV